jgi:hypothetical protein
MKQTIAFILLVATVSALYEPVLAETPETTPWLDFDAEDASLPAAENCTVSRDKHVSR